MTMPDVPDDASIGRWLYDLCKMYGASEHTCWIVAGLFLSGLAADRDRRWLGAPDA